MLLMIVYFNHIFNVHTNMILNTTQLLSFVVDPITSFKNMHLKMLNRSTKKNLAPTELRTMQRPSAWKQTNSPLYDKCH